MSKRRSKYIKTTEVSMQLQEPAVEYRLTKPGKLNNVPHQNKGLNAAQLYFLQLLRFVKSEAELNEKRYNLCVSNEIINEYEEIIAKKTSPLFASEFIRSILLRVNTILVNPFFHFELISRDPDDNKFVDCAIIANADYIVSQDAHFNVLKTIDFPKVIVIRIEDFMKEL